MEITDFSEEDLKGVVYRSAKLEDYDGVLAISHGLYGGRDIVPAMYHTYLQDPLRVSMVATCKGKVVVFASSKIVDNGQTMEGEALRSHTSVRGKGIFDRLQHGQIVEVILPKFPNIKKIRAVTVNSGKLTDIRRSDIVPRSLRSSIDLAWEVSANTLEQGLTVFQKQDEASQIEGREISVATEANLQEIFTNTAFQTSFIPSGILVRDSHTFHLDFPENIPLLFHDRCENIFISRDDHGVLASISFGTGIEMGVSMETYRYTIDYYGKPQLNLLKMHIIRHISDIPRLFRKSQTVKNIYINLFVLADMFNQSDLKEVMMFMSHDLQIFSKTSPRPQQIVLQNDDSVNFFKNMAKM